MRMSAHANTGARLAGVSELLLSLPVMDMGVLILKGSSHTKTFSYSKGDTGADTVQCMPFTINNIQAGRFVCRYTWGPLWALRADLGLVQIHQQRVQVQGLRQNVHPAPHHTPSIKLHAMRKSFLLSLNTAAVSEANCSLLINLANSYDCIFTGQLWMALMMIGISRQPCGQAIRCKGFKNDYFTCIGNESGVHRIWLPRTLMLSSCCAGWPLRISFTFFKCVFIAMSTPAEAQCIASLHACGK